MEQTVIREEVKIPIENITLYGNLAIPENAKGLVIFSHGSGSSRFSPRNNFVAEQLQKRSIGTLLLDLLSKHEDAIYENRFDIDLLTQRLVSATRWAKELDQAKDLPLGYFGASTGAASALKAVPFANTKISAVVSRGGRPDLTLPILDKVDAPTLLIVGSRDERVIEMNQHAYEQLAGEKELQIIEGATHLFEEPGKLEEVAELAGKWFDKHFKS